MGKATHRTQVLLGTVDAPRLVGYRQAIRERCGPNGEGLLDILWELAQGKPFTPESRDGRYMAPIVPSPDVRLRAALNLADRLLGTPVSALEQPEAEEKAMESAALAAISDTELEAQVSKALTGSRILPEINIQPNVKALDAEPQKAQDIKGLLARIRAARGGTGQPREKTIDPSRGGGKGS